VYQPLVKIRVHQPGHLDSISLGYRVAICKANRFKRVMNELCSSLILPAIRWRVYRVAICKANRFKRVMNELCSSLILPAIRWRVGKN
jgi:hypothetical protein